jgi:hypothetical protein
MTPAHLRILVILALLFAPSAWFAWQNADMPNFGYYHDDGVYFTGAKSLAQSGTYRIESLPGTPFQTKYPPLLPAWHSLAWFIEPRFPENLRVAMLLQWIWLPVLAWLTLILAEQWGFAGYKRWLLVVMLAVSPYPLFFGTAILSEIPFAVLLAACLILLGRGHIAWAALFGGLAFLTRTAGIVLLVSVPAVLILQQRRRQDALRFAGVMLPFVIGWFVWSKLYQVQAGSDLVTYYVNYLGYHLRVFRWSDAHLFLWKNIDFLLLSAGSFLLPNVFGGLIMKILTQVLGVASLVGAFRLARTNPKAAQYGVFAGLSCVILLLWSFPPNERFLIPLLPLLLAGYIVEFSRIAAAMVKSLRHKDVSQRIAGGLISVAFGAFLAFAVYTQLKVQFEMMPVAMETARLQAAQRLPMYEWIRQHTKPDATFLVAYDSPLHLHTGRRGSYQIIDSAAWYRDEAATAQKSIEAYARANGFHFILWTPFDRRNDSAPEEYIEVGKILAKSPTVRMVREFPNVFLFELLPVH